MSGSQTQTLYSLLGIGLLAAFGMGFVTGRVSAPEAKTTVTVRDTPDVKTSQPTENKPSAVKTRVVTAKSLSPSAWLKKKRMKQKSAGLTTKAGQQLAIGKSPIAWDDVTQRFRHAFDNPEDFAAQEAAEESINALKIRLGHDPVALKQAIDRFKKVTDINEALHFAAVFSRVSNPAIKKLGLDLIGGANPAYLKAAGFEMLSNIDPEAAVKPALDVVGSDSDPELRRAALDAIPDNGGLEQENASDIVRQMKSILETDADPVARSRAAILLGSYYQQPADLNCVLTAMKNDADYNVRANCATALKLSGRRDQAVKAALVTVLDRADEDLVVKDNAFMALRTMGSLTPAQKASFDKFKSTIESLKPTEKAPELIESDQQ